MATIQDRRAAGRREAQRLGWGLALALLLAGFAAYSAAAIDASEEATSPQRIMIFGGAAAALVLLDVLAAAMATYHWHAREWRQAALWGGLAPLVFSVSIVVAATLLLSHPQTQLAAAGIVALVTVCLAWCVAVWRRTRQPDEASLLTLLVQREPIDLVASIALTVDGEAGSLSASPTATDGDTILEVNGARVNGGDPGTPVAFAADEGFAAISVAARRGEHSEIYHVTVETDRV